MRPTLRLFSPIALATLALASPALAGGDGPCPGRYLPGPPLAGVDGWVSALCSASTPQGERLYIGGRFKVAGNLATNHAAAWNGTSWESMSVELTDDNVPDIYSIVRFNNTVYAVGRFDTVNGSPAGNLMRWNGLAWFPWTTGTSGGSYGGSVFGTHVHNNELYIYGSFTSANGVACTGIARWTGATFAPVGNFNGGTVWGMTTHNGQIHVTGEFNTVNGQQCNNVARFNGAQWLPVSTGLENTGYSLASYGGNLYCAGAEAIGLDLNEHDGINYFNGVSWQALPGGDAEELRVLGGVMFAGGYGEIAGVDGKVAAFGGNTWYGFGAGIASWGGQFVSESPRVEEMQLFGNQLFAAGEFSKAGTITAQNIARWTGSAWTRVNSAVNASDSRSLGAMGVFNGQLVVTGQKKLINGVEGGNTIWTSPDAVNFQPMPGVFEGGLTGFRQYNGDLFAYGYVTFIDGAPIEGIARWTGASWVALGTGLKETNSNSIDARVYDTAEYNGKLICAGYFNEAGPIPASRIAAWNGTSWSNLGAGTDGYIDRLAVHNGSLYAAGSMTVAGGVAVEGCARWDGAAWHAVGLGQGIGEFRDMIEFEGELYACRGSTVYRLGPNDQWQVYSVLPNDENSPTVYQLTTYRGELCARGILGDFDGYGGGRQIMVLHDGQWAELSDDRHNETCGYAMEFKGHLLTTGSFTAVGHAVSPNLARFRPDTPYIWDQPDDISNPCPGSTVHFALQASGAPTLTYRWHRDNVPLNDGPTGTGSIITGAATEHMQIADISSSDDALYKCTVTSSLCGAWTSRTVRLTVYCYCGPADMGKAGGLIGPDGMLDNNDFIAFIELFFTSDPQADVGIAGGLYGQDGLFDNNDFIAFINMFFAGCE